MITVSDVFEYLKEIAPLDLQMPGDNSGLLVGDPAAEVSGVLCCLDVTLETVREATERDCDLLVSHHPAIFRPVSRIDAGGPVHFAVRNDLAVVSMHTNMDAAAGGVNDGLARKLGLQNVRPLALPDGSDLPGTGRIGALPRTLSFEEFAETLTDLFGALRITGEKEVRTVAVLGGSGGDWLSAAAAAGADAFVTGELRHHEHLEARRLGIAAAEAGHFATEEHVRGIFKELLKNRFPNLRVKVSSETPPYRSFGGERS